jgi:hypothetical protein
MNVWERRLGELVFSSKIKADVRSVRVDRSSSNVSVQEMQAILGAKCYELILLTACSSLAVWNPQDTAIQSHVSQKALAVIMSRRFFSIVCECFNRD